MARPKKIVDTKSDIGDVGKEDATQTIPPKEITKKFLAQFFVISTLLAIGLIPATLLFFKKIDLSGFKDIVLTLGSVLGGPLGIIISNYFKEGADQ